MPKGIYKHIPHNGTFQRGCVPWIKGRKLSPEHKEKIRLAHLGLKHSQEDKEKMSKSQKLRFQKNPAWNKGKKMSPEAIENNRKAQTGKKQSIETREKHRQALLGEKNPNYIDGTSKFTAIRYADFRLKLWREQVFKRDNFICQKCLRKGLSLEAHHIKSWAQYPDLRYDLNNGQTLCKECHKLTDNYKGKCRRKKFYLSVD
jgi:hypothetical protein